MNNEHETIDIKSRKEQLIETISTLCSSEENQIRNQLDTYKFSSEDYENNLHHYRESMEEISHEHMTYSLSNIDKLVWIKNFCNIQDHLSGKTLLHMAIENNNTLLARTICIASVPILDINIFDINGKTPLHIAVQKNDLYLVNLLLILLPAQWIVEEVLESAYPIVRYDIISCLERHLKANYYQYDPQQQPIFQVLQKRECFSQQDSLINIPKTFITARDKLLHKRINANEISLDADSLSFPETVYYEHYRDNNGDRLLINSEFFVRKTSDEFKTYLEPSSSEGIAALTKIQEIYTVLNNDETSTKEKSIYFNSFLKKYHMLITEHCPPETPIRLLSAVLINDLDEECFFLALHYFYQQIQKTINMQLSGWDRLLHYIPIYLEDLMDADGILEAILKLKPNINIQNIYGMTPFHIAVVNPNPTVIEKLLELHPDITIQDARKDTPFNLAVHQSLHPSEDIYDTTETSGAMLKVGMYALKNFPLQAVKQKTAEAIYKSLVKKTNGNVPQLTLESMRDTFRKIAEREEASLIKLLYEKGIFDKFFWYCYEKLI